MNKLIWSRNRKKARIRRRGVTPETIIYCSSCFPAGTKLWTRSYPTASKPFHLYSVYNLLLIEVQASRRIQYIKSLVRVQSLLFVSTVFLSTVQYFLVLFRNFIFLCQCKNLFSISYRRLLILVCWLDCLRCGLPWTQPGQPCRLHGWAC